MKIAANLARGIAPGMRPREGWLQGHPQAVFAGVDGELPAIPDTFSAHRSRNNQLLLAALAQIQPQVDRAIAQYGRERVAVVLGTSTSGLDEGDAHVTPDAWRQGKRGPAISATGAGRPIAFSQPLAGAGWPGIYAVNRLLLQRQSDYQRTPTSEAGLADVAIVGGADTLSRMPINGFHSLESLSTTQCQPFARDRNGITIGEGAALVLLTREPQPVALLGIGESSDARHISAPHPEGEGRSAPSSRRWGMRASPLNKWVISTCTAPPRRLTIE